MVDSANMLLRSAGVDLADKLIRMATSTQKMQEEDGEWVQHMQQAMQGIVQVMASWHSILTMTSAALGCTEVADAFEKELVQVHTHLQTAA